MIAAFQMEHWQVQKLTINMPAPAEKPVTMDYFANYGWQEDTEGWRGEIGLAFRQMKNEKEALYEIIAVGQFTGRKENMREEEFEKRLRLNGCATLIPMMRAVLETTLSAMGHHGEIGLPNINVNEIQWRKIPGGSKSEA